MRNPLVPAAVLLAALTPAADAHYNMLLPSTASAKKGEAVTLTYQFGHPFEHQLFDAPRPESLIVLSPSGKRTDLAGRLEKTTTPAGEGKQVVAYTIRFTPEERGDYVFLLQAPPIWMEEDGEFLEDTVKVVLHVQAQKGWAGDAGAPFELVPLTRPYGLQPGLAFQAQVESRGAKADGDKAPRGRLVEVEHYNPAPPKELPPDEQITRTARTDRGGVVTCTLTDPGWWCLTAARDHGEKERDGKRYPVRQRSTLWVFVDDRPGSR
jgi:cobalt/nickel transport protein